MQGNDKSLLERLGYTPDAKLLIVHADDLGIAHSVNAATMAAFRTGLVNSGSVMVPCPWFPEIVQYARSHPEADLGIHLTLTSERTACRWGPISPKNKVRSLIDKEGYFHLGWTKDTPIRLDDVRREMRAQVEKALAAGIRPSHIDSHQFTLYERGPDIFDVLIRLGREYKLPVFVCREWFTRWPYLHRCLNPGDIVLDHQIEVGVHIHPECWAEFYIQAFMNLHPGITELIVHLGYDNEELRAFSSDRATWGSEWRQRDFDFFTSPAFRELLRQCGVRLVQWRDLMRVSFPNRTGGSMAVKTNRTFNH